MKEELKRDVEESNFQQDTLSFNVYKTTTGFYISEDMCDKYNVGDRENKKNIKNKICYKVTKGEIDSIESQAKFENINLIPKYITIFDLQLILSFTVYIDTNHNNKMYISNNLCGKYGIRPIAKRMIEGNTYCNITEEDLEKIENQTRNDKVVLKKKYVKVQLDDEMDAKENLFIYYYDIQTAKLYVQRNIYELARNLGIDIDGDPKIIEDKNCYSLTDKQLNEIEVSSQSRGVEKIIKPPLLQKISYEDIKPDILIKDNNSEKKTAKENNNWDMNPTDTIKVEIEKQICEKIENMIQEKNIYMEFEETLENAKEKFIIQFLKGHNINICETETELNKIKKNTLNKIIGESLEENPYNPKEIKDCDTYINNNNLLEKAQNEITNKQRDYISNLLMTNDVNTEIMNQEIMNYLRERSKYYKKELLHIIIDNSEIKELLNGKDLNNDINDTIINKLNLKEETIIQKISSKSIEDKIISIAKSDSVKKDEINILLNTELFKRNIYDDLDYDEDDDFIEEEEEQNIKQENLIVYLDKDTNKLYIPKEYSENPFKETKTIMKKDCVETTTEELNKITNKNIVLIDVYLSKDEKYDIIVCNANGKLFVSKNNLDQLNYNIDNPHKIIVNKELYYEISKSDLENIRSKRNEGIHINILLKHIIPAKKEQ